MKTLNREALKRKTSTGKTLKRGAMVVVTILLIFLIGSVQTALADGGDLVVPKGNVQGVIDNPPAAGAGEYSTGPVMLSNGLGNFQVQTYRSADGSVEEIQFLFTITDASSNVGDEIRIFFDTNHNHTLDNTAPNDRDRGIVVRRSPAAVNRTNVNLFGAPTILSPLAAAQWSVQDNPANWLAEVKIEAGDLNLSYIPSLMGMYIEVINAGEGDGRYPTASVKIDMESWANLKTRLPLEYVLLLDQSGSMLRDFNGDYPPVLAQRWQSAKAASDIFAQLIYALRPQLGPTEIPYFNDKIGLATYYWADGAVEPDESTAVKSLAQLESITVDGYVDSGETGPPDPVFGQHTPIKRGVNTAFAMFDSGAIDRITILLSDGIHDRPTSNYNEFPYVFPAGTGTSDYQVNTVALGPDGSVGTQLLDTIKDDFSGFGGAYTSALQREELIDAFAENLFSHLYVNRATVNNSGEFQVNANEGRLLVMQVWNSTTVGERNFWLERGDGSVIRNDMLPANAIYHHYRNTGLDYEVAYYLVDSPGAPGTWQTVRSDGSGMPEVGDNTFALFDPTVYAFFTISREGEAFLLKAVLKEDGVPITEPDATVVADVSRPMEGLGTYVSTAQSNCTFAPPTLPQSSAVEVTTGVAFQPLSATTVPTSTMVQTGTTEVLTPRFAKVQALFETCEKSGLNRSGLNALRLYDDGTHGDEVAHDGIFTLWFTETQHEGTYTFQLRASGKAPSGSEFSRTRTLSIHKNINVAPEVTEFNSAVLVQEETRHVVEYYVIPRDPHGEYLGSGHIPQIEFRSTGGEWQGPVIDYNNGIYARVLQFDPTQGTPEVTPVVQGKPIRPNQPPLDRLCVEGLVINHEEQPLAGWNVSATPYDTSGALIPNRTLKTTSGPDGTFLFEENLSTGLWHFVIELQPGWAPVTADRFDVPLTYGRYACEQVRFKVRRLVTVEVLKVDAEHVPLSGWIIRAEPGAGNRFAVAQEQTTDANGVATFQLSPGQWVFSERAPAGISYTPISPPTGVQKLDVTVPGPHRIRFKNRIEQQPQGCIEVIKRDLPPANAPQTPTGLPGWYIGVLRADGSLAADGVTDGAGRITFSGLAPGPYTVYEEVVLGWEPVTPTAFSVTVVDDPTCKTVTFQNQQVEPAFCVVGRKVDTNGLVGIPDWQITAEPLAAGGYVPAPVVTDGLGNFRIDFPENDYRIPGAKYRVCEEIRSGWLPHTDTCQKVTLPQTPGTCVWLPFDFENQQVGHFPGPPDPPAGCRAVHIVQSGEGLYAIGSRYGVSPADMLKANPWVRNQPHRWLYAGQEVCIP